MKEPSIPLPAQTEISRLGIMHLPRYWYKARLKKNNELAADALLEEWNIDNAMLNALGLGLEQTIVHLFNSKGDFADFETWIESNIDIKSVNDRIQSFNEFILHQQLPGAGHTIENVLTDKALECWDTNGYLILRNAISLEDCKATVQLICDHIKVNPEDPTTWYDPHPDRQGIMVQLFQHPLLEKNRNAPLIRKAYEQLWGRTDIWVSTDRVGFNPPETENWTFPGPRMHWDVSLALPIPFGLQGILYLTDTAANQGAFSLVPGFQNKVAQWLNSLPPGADPRKQDMESLGVLPIAAGAGDFIIWHQALPHGSSPNHSSIPRFVQYINYAPLDMEHQEKWI